MRKKKLLSFLSELEVCFNKPSISICIINYPDYEHISHKWYTCTNQSPDMIIYNSLESFTLNYTPQFVLSLSKLSGYSNIYSFDDLFLHVHCHSLEIFKDKMKNYLNNDRLMYDNLIHFTMIVKNAGERFKDVLLHNLPYIDRWTILDTGSTDNTISIIQNVLKDKKGTLYQEPFINFRESRNRCLDLSTYEGRIPCEYTIMLDDTYQIYGDLRKFLIHNIDDDAIESFSLYIKTDVQYVSNRIIKSKTNLRYINTIHETIQPNKNYLIPIDISYLSEYIDEYMNQRTIARKQLDLNLLFDEYNKDPTNPRHSYYIAGTYLAIKNWEDARKWYRIRLNYKSSFEEEEYDALYKIAFLSDFYLDTWENAEKYYLSACTFNPKRPESFYMLSEHYRQLSDYPKAYHYLVQAFNCLQFVPSFQMNSKINMYYNHIPNNLILVSYYVGDYASGLLAAQFTHKYSNLFKSVAVQWINIFTNLNKVKPIKVKEKYSDKKLFCWISDFGWEDWDGSALYSKGLGGSETFCIKYTETLFKLGYESVLFCKCKKQIRVNGVTYIPIEQYIDFLSTYEISYGIINRCTEYLAVNYHYQIPTILILHDLFRENEIIISNDKYLKKIFTLTEWHSSYVKEKYPMYEKLVDKISHGFDYRIMPEMKKKPFSFIFSSFANRGLLPLLRIFPKIVSKYPEATLNLFCDLSHPFILKHYNEHIDEVNQIIKENRESIKNYGWVTQNILHQYIAMSHIWLYPCTFTETFCLTALEMAAGQVLCLTPNTGGLNETVGDRGYQIPLYSTETENEWQNQVLNILDEIFKKEKGINNKITQNLEWSKTKDFINVVSEFIKKIN